MNKNPIAAEAYFAVIEHKRMKSSAFNEIISVIPLIFPIGINGT